MVDVAEHPALDITLHLSLLVIDTSLDLPDEIWCKVWDNVYEGAVGRDRGAIGRMALVSRAAHREWMLLPMWTDVGDRWPGDRAKGTGVTDEVWRCLILQREE